MLRLTKPENNPSSTNSVLPPHLETVQVLEREEYFSILEAALKETSAGSGKMAFVGGEAGIGKTTLVGRFAHSQKHNIPVLWGMCDPLFTPRPLGPLYDMAGQLPPRVVDLLYSEANPLAVFSAFLEELRTTPTLVIFEDVHWADEATLDLLRFIGRRIANTSALVVSTYREDEIDNKHPLSIVLGGLASSPSLTRISLPPLSLDAVQTLAGDRELDLCALHANSNGNPFFINEVLSSDGDGIPYTVREMISARAARLTPPALAVLETAAIIGPRAESWLMTEMAGENPDPIDECISSGLLLEQGDTLIFRHELARDTIVDSIPTSRRRKLHRTALNILRSSPNSGSYLSEIVHHAKAAGDRDAVLEFGPVAAKQASAVGAHAEAATLYAFTLKFADKLPARERAQLLEAYAKECNLVEDFEKTIESLNSALKIWREEKDALKQVELLGSLSIALRNYGSNSEAEHSCNEALEIVEVLPPNDELCRVYRAKATLRLANLDLDEAIQWGNKAVAEAEKHKKTRAIALAQCAIGAAMAFKDYNQGMDYLNHRLEAQAETAQTDIVASLYFYLGSCSVELYRFNEAERYLAEGLQYIADRALFIFKRSLLAWSALSCLYLGKWEEADRITRELVQRPIVSVLTKIPAFVALGRLRARRGHPGAWQILSKALPLAIQADTVSILGQVYAARAEAAWLNGKKKNALSEAKAVYQRCIEKRQPWLVGELAYWQKCAGETVKLPKWTAKPFKLQISGKWQEAAEEWERLGCPYEQARALAEGDAVAKQEALRIFDDLGAIPAAETLRRSLRKEGIREIQRKPREATRENPYGLTNRQMEILSLLAENMSNREIANRLFISAKTVDHHVSSILSTLGVHSRREAATIAGKKSKFFT